MPEKMATIVQGTIKGLANGATQSAITGHGFKNLNWGEIAANSFGNALVDELAGAIEKKDATASTQTSEIDPIQYGFSNQVISELGVINQNQYDYASYNFDALQKAESATVNASDYKGSVERIAREKLGKNASQHEINTYVGQLIELNQIKNPRFIKANQVLTLPNEHTPLPTTGLEIYAKDILYGENLKAQTRWVAQQQAAARQAVTKQGDYFDFNIPDTDADINWFEKSFFPKNDKQVSIQLLKSFNKVTPIDKTPIGKLNPTTERMKGFGKAVLSFVEELTDAHVGGFSPGPTIFPRGMGIDSYSNKGSVTIPTNTYQIEGYKDGETFDLIGSLYTKNPKSLTPMAERIFLNSIANRKAIQSSNFLQSVTKRGTIAEQAANLTTNGGMGLNVNSYGSLVKDLKGTGIQANHLNQDAAFKSIIPTNEGAAVGLRGNAFTEIGSPHYNFHNSLEGFWNQYRKGGTNFGSIPTNAQYGNAVEKALRAAGISPKEATQLSNQAMQNRVNFGLLEDQLVPRVPGRLPQKK